MLRVTLRADEWGVILTGLNELPAKFSYQLINRLQEQFATQAPREQQIENGLEAERAT